MSVNYNDTSTAIYDPLSSQYYDKESLDKEMERSFDLCNSCRLCFKYCPSFPSLFAAMDAVDAKVENLQEANKKQVIDECFLCDNCYSACPYTKTDRHPYNINFPALMQRAKLVHARDKRLGLRARLLSNPDALGKIASVGLGLPKLINWVMKNKWNRVLMHQMLGIHKNKRMPQFTTPTFSTYFRKLMKKRNKAKKPFRELAKKSVMRLKGIKPQHSENTVFTEKVVLFSTCFVNFNNTQLGIDAFSVLEKNNVEVLHPKQNCCGMPALEAGHLKLALKKIKSNVRSLYPYVQQGYKVLAINPSCSLVLKREAFKFIPDLVLRQQAEELAKATFDLHEYLAALKKAGKFNQEFKSSPQNIAYHVPCHLKAQSIGLKSRDIMRLIPNTKIKPIVQCCGHDGSFAMKKEFFESSLEVGSSLFTALESIVKASQESVVATDCPLAAIQIGQAMHLEQLPMHPVQVLEKAYRRPEQGGFASDAHAKTAGQNSEQPSNR